MNNVSLIEDKKSGEVFAAIVSSPKGIKAFGASGQGAAWAKWVNDEQLTLQQLEVTLDSTLVVQKPRPANNIEIDDLVSVFDKETLGLLNSEINKKQLIHIIETKNDPADGANEDFAFEMEHLYAEEENISNWPITDISLASIDVAYKQVAIQYKAKAFNLDRAASSMVLQVKGVRAIWDPDMPGGGGYRCPDNTPNGGQFTNRIGTGCTFGVMRRIGRGLQAASLRDINAPIVGDGSSDAQLSAIYNLGRAMELRGAKRQQRLQEKFRRRVQRRVDKLAKDANKPPTFRQIYQSVNPETRRRDRARIAAGRVLQRMGGDIANAGFDASQSRRLSRKTPKTAKQPWSDIIDPNITATQRKYGGTLDTNFGGLFIPEVGRLYDFDAMVPTGGLLEMTYGNDVIDKEDANYPFFMSFDEIAKVRGNTDANFEISQMTQLVNTAALGGGWTVQTLTPDEVKKLRKERKGEFVDFLNMLQPHISADLRVPDSNGRGKDIPTAVSDLGHVVAVDQNGDLVFWQNLQQMSRLSPYVRGDVSDDFINNAFARIGSAPITDGRQQTLLRGMPDLMVSPEEINNLYSVRNLKPDATPYTLAEVLDNHVNELNVEGQTNNTGLTFKRISDKEFKTQFSRAWKNRNKNQSDWNKQNSTLANRLRNAADAIQSGTRRQNRRRNAQNIPQTPTTPQQASAPSNVPTPVRQQRGATPRTGGIIQRFRENQNERLRRRTVAKRRTAKGRKPMPTDTRLDRARKRLRRRANRLAEIPDAPEDYTSYSAGLPDPAAGLGGLLRPNGTQDDIPEPFRLDPLAVQYMRANIPVVQDAFAKPSDKTNGLFEAIEFLDRRSREGNGVAGLRPSVEQFDVDNVGELNRLVDETATEFGDILQEDRLNNTNRYRGVVMGERKQEWFFVDGALTAVSDTENDVYHQFSKDGKHHLFSVLTDTDPNTGQQINTIIASDYTRDRILGKGGRRSIRDRIMSRRRVFPPGSPAASPTQTSQQSLRARSRTIINKGTSALLFGKNTTGVKLRNNYTAQEIAALMAAAEVELDAHMDRFRNRLGIVDLSLPIDDTDVLYYLANVRRTNPKQAAMEANDWHNTRILAEAVETNNYGMLDFLKPQARLQVLSRANVTGDNTVNPKKQRPAPKLPGNPPNPPSGGTPIPSSPNPSPSSPGSPSTPPSRPTTPSSPSSPSAPPSAPSTPPPPATPPAPVNPPSGPQPAPPGPPPSSTPAPSGIVFSPGPVTPTIVPQITPAVVDVLPTSIRPQTGPDLEPGVGNVALGITYVPQQDGYFDTNTGEFIEDLSGLPISDTLDIPQVNIDESSNIYPTVPIPGTMEQMIVAPGVDKNNLVKLIKSKPSASAKRAVTTGIYTSFKQAAIAYRKAPAGKQQLRDVNYVPYIVRIDLNSLPDNPADHAEAVLKQALAQSNTSDEIFGPNPATKNAIESALQEITSGTKQYTLHDAMNIIRGKSFSRMGLPDDPSEWNGVVYLNAGNGYQNEPLDILELNQTLQVQEKYRKKYLLHKADIDAGIPLNPADEAELDSLKTEATMAWEKTAQSMIDHFISNSRSRDTALATYRGKKGKRSKDTFILRGVEAELASAIIDKEVANNPFALVAVGEAKRSRMQQRSRSLNIRRRAVEKRLQGQGRRNTGLYDNDPDVLDPWKGNQPPSSARMPDVIEKLVSAHKSQGIFEDATQGNVQFTEEQILMLAQMGELYDAVRSSRGIKVYGPPGTPLEFTEFDDLGQAQLAVVWYYNGWDSLPATVNLAEVKNLLQRTDIDGVPEAVVMTRGISGTPSEQFQRSNAAIRGDRFIPGQGMSAAGRGEYWSQQPRRWATHHGGSNGTVMAVLTKDMHILTQRSFNESINHALVPGLRELHDILGNPGDENPSPFSGQTRFFSSATIAGIKPDPITGMYDAKALDDLQKDLDEITKVGNPLSPNQPTNDGSWGAATLESIAGTAVMPDRSVFPETRLFTSPEEIQEAQKQREYYNAWARQHMQWMIDLARQIRDESGQDAVQAKIENQRIRKAMSMLVHLTDENRASLMGVDAFYVDTDGGSGGREVLGLFTRGQVWGGMPDANGPGNTGRSGLANGAASRILMFNRSAMIYFQDPVGYFTDWDGFLQGITYQDGTTAMRPEMRF